MISSCVSTEASTIPLLVWKTQPPSSIDGSATIFIFESTPYSYVIFGIVALFILAFLVMQTAINPDGDGAKSAKDFIKRLRRFNPKIIINCCTGGHYGEVDGLQKQVQKVIDGGNFSALKLIGSHPSSAFFARGFCKI